MRILIGVIALLAALVLAPASAAAAAPVTNVLVFHKTAGFQHPSIPAGITAIKQLGQDNGFSVTATDDASQFTAANLARFQAVVWLSTTGDVLDAAQQSAFETYIAGGGGYVGIHAAADTEYDWAWYGGLVGAYFQSHPADQTARVKVEDRSNVSTSHLPQTWTHLDEWYNYRTNPRTGVRVLASLDESSYTGGTMGDHPITWCHDYNGGRAWYTGLGHTEQSYADPNFTTMLLGGIKIAAGASNADCRPETGYTALFDGTQASLDQWRQAGPGGFTLADGTITSNGGMGLLWFPVRAFSNYSLKVDWMMPGDDNGGVFIGFPDPQGDPWRPVDQGHEIQIDATDADPSRTTGSVYSFRAPDPVRDTVLNPPGQWNAYEIAVHGQHVEIWLNGVKINDYTSQRDIALGHIGVQNDGAGADINYRDIRVRTDGGTGGTDLARGRPVTVSSVEPGSPHAGSNAVDGNAQTRWGSAYSDPQWISVDLGAAHGIDRVRLNWETAYARAYRVQTSPDNTNWTTRYETTTGDGGIDDLDITGSGRYVRVEGTQRATQWGYSLWDLQVIGADPAAAAPPPTTGFEKVKLDGGLSMGEPIELSVLPDGKVLYINRGTTDGGGQVRLYNPTTKLTTVALTIPLDARFEDGLIGITLHPRFTQTNWVYLFYSPKVTPLVNRISRFTFNGNTLSAERTVIEWPTERDLCCHSAGSMTWDSAENLYFAVGDNTNSGGDSAGMAPIDERTSRNPQYDAQRTAGNTNDLRGKINRIHPVDNGTYTIPSGNLFPQGTAQTRPEIYVMGLRNPYRVWVDKRAGNTLYWGEVGPDAGATIPNRGPAAYDEFNRATGPGNFGWPYCGGPNTAYNDWDFAANQPRAWFPCGGNTGPVNDSPRNTGLRQLPPTKPALVWEQHGGSVDWPALDNPGGCGAPNHTEVYHYDPALSSDVKWPQYYDNKLLISEYCRNWVKEVQFDNGNPVTGRPTTIEPVLAGMNFVHPIDMEFGQDGSLYLLEYGSGYFSGAPDAGLYKINYVQGGRSPEARASASRDNGLTPLTVQFSSAGSADPDGDALTYAWDFTNDGTTDSTAANPSFTYTANGSVTARLTVRDGTGKSGTTTIPIVVGNDRPTMRITAPPAGGVYSWQQNVTITATATDPQDGQIPCAQVVVRIALGHEEHAHEVGQGTGCGFTFNTGEIHSGLDARQFYVVRATYTDRGAPGSVPLTGETSLTLWPKQWQAEHFDELHGPQVITAAGAEGGKRLGDIQTGEWVRHHAVSLQGVTGVRARVSSDKAGNVASFRYDSPTGPEIARVTVPNTGGWDSYQDITVPVTGAVSQARPLYVVFTGTAGQAILDLDSYTFTGPGVNPAG
jgi:type 1 glutamine amidotransferase/PKD repeat protein